MGDEMDSLTFFPRASASHGAAMCLLESLTGFSPDFLLRVACISVSVFQVLSTLTIERATGGGGTERPCAVDYFTGGLI